MARLKNHTLCHIDWWKFWWKINRPNIGPCITSNFILISIFEWFKARQISSMPYIFENNLFITMDFRFFLLANKMALNKKKYMRFVSTADQIKGFGNYFAAQNFFSLNFNMKIEYSTRWMGAYVLNQQNQIFETKSIFEQSNWLNKKRNIKIAYVVLSPWRLYPYLISKTDNNR